MKFNDLTETLQGRVHEASVSKVDETNTAVSGITGFPALGNSKLV